MMSHESKKVDFNDNIIEKQEKSYSHRLWILLTAYEKSLDGKNIEISDVVKKYNTSQEDVIAAFRILEKQYLINCEHWATNDVPYNISISGNVINLIENAPITYFEILKKDVEELQRKNEYKIKEMELKIARESTKTEKYRMLANITEIPVKASRWFDRIFN